MLADPATGRVVVTTDAFGYPAVGVAEPKSAAGIRFIPALEEGDEAGEPCALLPDGRTPGPPPRERRREPPPPGRQPRAWRWRARSRCRPARSARPIVLDGRRLRFPFSAPDEPWRPASFDLGTGAFSFDPLPAAGQRSTLVTARVASFPSGAGPMPALVYPPAPGDGPLSGSGLAVVALHGGPIARYGADVVPEFQLFARLGSPDGGPQLPGQHRVRPRVHALAVRPRPAPSTWRRSPP